jgi:aminopeptidase C
LVVIVHVGLAVLTLTGVVAALITKMSVEAALLSLVMPMLPLFTRTWKESSSHRVYAEHSERLLHHIEALWPEATSGKLSDQRLNAEARAIQTELFRRRVAAPFVPTFYFEWRHRDHDKEMKKTANKLVRECKC